VPVIITGLAIIGQDNFIGQFVGRETLIGMLIGSLVSAFMLAVMMANSGGAWDNAKKYIEAGNFGGKGSEAHKAAVVGDTVGDPFKDTAGPSLNILHQVAGDCVAGACTAAGDPARRLISRRTFAN
jgi:K(+)-stimulated pyrophosphate-energized sodium pump